jgi:hypothetical protein
MNCVEENGGSTGVTLNYKNWQKRNLNKLGVSKISTDESKILNA